MTEEFISEFIDFDEHGRVREKPALRHKLEGLLPEELDAIKRRRMEVKSGQCKPECSICNGSGYYRCDVPIEHPDFGKLFICPNVDRWKLPGAVRYGITEEETRNLRWDDLDTSIVGVEQAIHDIRAVMDRGFGWVMLSGSYGLGKTMMLKIAIGASINAGKDAAYVRMAEILDNLREGFDERTGVSETARLDWWTDLKILAIDEIDRIRETEYGTERRFVLLDRRYEQACRQQSITLLASNIEPEKLPGYLSDRILDGRFAVVRFAGKSKRSSMEW